MKRLLLLLLCMLIGLMACSGKEQENSTTKNNLEEESTSTPTSHPIEDRELQEVEEEQKNAAIDFTDIPKVELTREGMKNQYGGILLEGVSLEQELEMEITRLMENNKQQLKDYLQTFTEETQQPEELNQAIIHLIGTPNYKEAIESAEAFQPDFPEPELPGVTRVENDDGETTLEKGKAILLLDASSSMLLTVDGRVKMDIAKEAVQQFAEVITQDNDISLVVYGHKGSESNADKTLSCEGIEEIYPMGTFNQERFEDSLNSFESKGWTPLAGAIDQAKEMSQGLEGDITLYIVSDGIETCDGDPVLSAESFVKDNEHRKVNIIGFNVDEDAEEQLIMVSEAGNGEYYSANNADELKNTMEYEWLPSRVDLAWAHTKAPGPWEELAEYDNYDIEHDKIKTLVQKENERYKELLALIREDEMLTDDVRVELNDIRIENYSSRMDELRDLRSEKINEIESIADDIRQRVAEWRDEMYRRKDEQGDLW